MKDYPALRTVLEDRILIITIDRPESLNAMNADVMHSLNDLFQLIPGREDISGVIVTGAGDRAFVAGADIKSFSFEGDAGEQNSLFGHETLNLVESCPKPVVAAVNGFALGGGCELAMACHMRIAGKHAKFGQPEINLGLIPGYAGTQRLPELIGKARALELLLSGRMIDAAEALALGLVNQVVETGEEVPAAMKLLKKMAEKAPLAAEKIIALVNLHYQDRAAAYRAESQAFNACFKTEDAREGVDAFLEKRKPIFKGR